MDEFVVGAAGTEPGSGTPEMILVASRKGGTGKSTVSAGVASAMAAMGKRVLLADLDTANRSLDLLLGCEDSVLYDWSDLLGGTETEKCVLPVPGHEGLYLLPAPMIGGGEAEPGDVCDAVFAAAAKLGCSHIIADSHADTDALTRAAARRAKTVLAVTTDEPSSLRGCESLAADFDAVGVENILLIVNRFDADAVLHGDVPGLRTVITRTRITLGGVVPESAEIRASHGAGLPLGGRRKNADGTGGATERIAARLTGEDRPLLETLPGGKRRRIFDL